MQRLWFLLALLPAWPSEPAAPYWLAITAVDAEASAAWYRDHLGFVIFDKMDVPEREIHIRFLELNGFHLEIAQRGDSFAVKDKVEGAFKRSQVRGYYKFGLLVSDLDALVAELRRKGVELNGKVIVDQRFGTRFAMINDLDGNLIQLFEKLKSATR